MPVALLLLVLSLLGGSESANILAAVPFPAISHQLPLRLVALELAKRGHNVTIITANPMKNAVVNYTEIDVSVSYKYLRSSLDCIAMEDWSPIDTMSTAEALGAKICEDALEAPEMQSFLRSVPKFDLVILERVATPCFYGLVHVVGSPPFIGYTSFGAISYIHLAHGNPSNPAYIPETLVGYSDHMSFWQRLYNTYLWLWFHHYWFNVILPQQDEIQKKYFGSDVPSVFEVERNFSIMLINNHFSASYPRPNLPNMIELTGLQLEPGTQTLSKAIQEWLDGADSGVVYFSLGTTVQASTMPEPKRRAFVEAFAELPQRVLWKWEADNVTDLPPNVRVSKWLPQQAVLAHPKVQLFITQGGLQSFNEAAYYGVPLIGIPFMGDQSYNVVKMVSAGIAYKLKFQDVRKDTVSMAIRTVLDDQSYRENMKRFSAVYREHQAESLPRAVWWIEHVLRHHGASHLRSAALELSWYQQVLLDVLAFVLLVTVTFGVALYFLVKFLISVTCKTRKVKSQ